jgi:GNAT superfamily N-acetyltransferase
MPELQVYGNLEGDQAEQIIAELVPVYLEGYAEPPYNFVADVHLEPFLRRTRGQVQRPGFTLVTARESDELIGFAFGQTFFAGGWWIGLRSDPPPLELLEAEKFAVIEFVVLPPYRGRGLGHRLMFALLAARPEPWAVLTTVPGATALDIYLHWGWVDLGEAHHAEELPVMRQLALRLDTP